MISAKGFIHLEEKPKRSEARERTLYGFKLISKYTVKRKRFSFKSRGKSSLRNLSLQLRLFEENSNEKKDTYK